MINKLKKFMALLVAIICLCSVSVGCGGDSDENSDKTVLRIACYDAGISVNWLYALETRFEEAYKDRSFEENKTGVDVIIDGRKTYTINEMISSKNHILVQGDLNIYEIYDNFMSLTDIVAEPNPFDNNTKSIKDKFSASQKDFLYAMDEQCYFIPNAQDFKCSVTYNVDLFEKNNLYFAKELVNGKSVFVTDISDERSFGPDGQTGVVDGIDYSIDDGLPATNEEFLLLCAEMSENGITPFIWTGANIGYSNIFLKASYASMAGKTCAYNYTFDSGDNEIDIISSFTGSVPNVSKTKITTANGYLMMQQKERYEALKLLQAIIDNGYYDADACFSTSMTMMEAQDKYVKSQPQGKPIAMLLDGNYWVNEARNTIQGVSQQYTKFANKFAVLPMPTVATGTHKDVQPNVDCYSFQEACEDYMMINKRTVQGNSAKEEVCKLFIQFANSDESLVEYTKVEKTPKSLVYDIDAATMATLPYYTQDMLTKKSIADKNGTLYQYGSSNLVYRNVRLAFGMGNQATTWTNGNEVTAVSAFKKNSLTAEQYFMNLRNINSKYLNYFK